MDKLYKYGMELGWVFQLRDDFLAEWGDSSKTGKPVGNDSREGKHSFAMMYGKDKLLSEIDRHVELAKSIVEEPILHEIVQWVASRDN
jgi:geranylgeranyl diphosphate synthase type I